MTNIGHFRAAGKRFNKFDDILPTRLWLAPPTRMDAKMFSEEGITIFTAKRGAKTEMPGCSLCIGNQAQVATVSDRLPAPDEYQRYVTDLAAQQADVYRSSVSIKFRIM